MSLTALPEKGYDLLAIWECVLAVIFHIAASILVVRAVRDRNARWWALAVLLHIVFNGVAVVALRSGGPVAAGLTLMAVSIVSVYVIVRFRPAEVAA